MIWLKVGITGWFGVPGENDNDRRVIDFCAESNTYFEYRNLHKYTRVVGGQDGGKVRSIIDLVLVKKAMLAIWRM